MIFIQLFSYSHVLCPDSFFTLKCSHKISSGAYAMAVTIHTLTSLAAKRLSSTSTMSMPCADVEHEFMLSATSRKQYQCYQYGQEQTEAPNHDKPTNYEENKDGCINLLEILKRKIIHDHKRKGKNMSLNSFGLILLKPGKRNAQISGNGISKLEFFLPSNLESNRQWN